MLQTSPAGPHITLVVSPRGNRGFLLVPRGRPASCGPVIAARAGSPYQPHDLRPENCKIKFSFSTRILQQPWSPQPQPRFCSNLGHHNPKKGFWGPLQRPIGVDRLMHHKLRCFWRTLAVEISWKKRGKVMSQESRDGRQPLRLKFFLGDYPFNKIRRL